MIVELQYTIFGIRVIINGENCPIKWGSSGRVISWCFQEACYVGRSTGTIYCSHNHALLECYKFDCCYSECSDTEYETIIAARDGRSAIVCYTNDMWRKQWALISDCGKSILTRQPVFLLRRYYYINNAVVAVEHSQFYKPLQMIKGIYSKITIDARELTCVPGIISCIMLTLLSQNSS